jgi:hypothetical protein
MRPQVAEVLQRAVRIDALVRLFVDDDGWSRHESAAEVLAQVRRTERDGGRRIVE